MTAAILCPGPSLHLTYASHDLTINLTIAVNEAATWYACDWWAVMDYPAIKKWGTQIIGKPGLFTRDQTDKDARKFNLNWRETVLAESLMPLCTTKDAPGWTLHTATSALVFAWAMGATQIEVYGADWKEESNNPLRGESRFTKERVIWGKLCEWLAGKGTTVKRILADTALRIAQ